MISASRRRRCCRASRRFCGSSSTRSGSTLRRLAIGRAGDDEPVHALHGPSRPSTKLDRQPVEQLGMRRQRALHAEVVFGFDEPSPK